MTGRGRPPIGPVINIRLTEEALDLVDQMAADKQLPRAEVIRALIEWGLIHEGYAEYY